MTRALLVDLGEGPGHRLYTQALLRALADHSDLRLSLAAHAAQASATPPDIPCLALDAATGLRNPLRRHLRQPLDLLRLRAFARAQRAELIHWVFPHPWMLALRPLPEVATLHDPVLHPGEDGPLARLILRRQLRADALILLGEPLRAAAAALFPEAAPRMLCAPHGAFAPLGAGPEPSAEAHAAAPAFLWFGRGGLYKGRELAIAAIQRLRAARPELRLILAGEGARGLEPAEGLELHPGTQEDAALAALLRRALAVLVPYTQASASGVIATALAAGRACIASELPSLRAMLRPGETGWLVPPGDVEALAAAMAARLEDIPGTLAAGRRGRDEGGEAGRARLAQAHAAAYAAALQRSSSSR